MDDGGLAQPAGHHWSFVYLKNIHDKDTDEAMDWLLDHTPGLFIGPKGPRQSRVVKGFGRVTLR